MARPPNQFFRREDFAEVQEPWIDKLLPKLNELARQTTYGVDGKLSVKDNLSAFWWSGDIGYFQESDKVKVKYPFQQVDPALPAKRSTPSIKAFPITIPNQISPAKVTAVMVAQGSDVTDGASQAQPALLGGVGWVVDGNSIIIHAINGMLPGRCYSVKLLLLGE